MKEHCIMPDNPPWWRNYEAVKGDRERYHKHKEKSMENEVWKDINGYEGLYQVSDKGRVKSLRGWNVNKDYRYHKRQHIMKQQDSGAGYLQVHLRKGKDRKTHFVHRLVAEAFLENPDGYTIVNHLDYDRANNAVENLEWCTQSMNVQYSAWKMRHPKTNVTSNTGERYISYRAKHGKYRVCVKKKEYGSYKTLEEAIRKRDEVMRELNE